MKVTWNSIANDPHQQAEKRNDGLYEMFVSMNDIVGWSLSDTEPEKAVYTLKKQRGYFPKNTVKREFRFDHARMYKTATNDRIYVAHCYLGNKGKEFSEKLEEWARETGVIAKVYNPTYDWYYYSENPDDFDATSLVIMHLPHLDVKVTSGQGITAL